MHGKPLHIDSTCTQTQSKESMDCSVLLLEWRIASGELAPGQTAFRHTGNSCVRGGISCVRLLPACERPPIIGAVGDSKHRQGAAKHV